MSDALVPKKSGAKPRTRLNALTFSPEINPLLDMRDIKGRNKYIRTGKPQELVNQATGEIKNVAIVHTIEEFEDIQFVKVFAAGVRAVYDLSKTATRVFTIVLEEYQSTPMSGGFVEAVYLAWFDNGLLGQATDISEKSFREGLRELIDNGFLSPKTPNMFWVNPSLFFKGDRVAFVKEYRRKQTHAVTDDRQGGLFNVEKESSSE